MLTDRFARSLTLAFDLQRDQLRKGTERLFAQLDKTVAEMEKNGGQRLPDGFHLTA